MLKVAQLKHKNGEAILLVAQMQTLIHLLMLV